MSTVDILILVIVLVSALIGLVRGLVKETFSLASWLAAFILAMYFAAPVARGLTDQLSDQSVRLVVAFTIIFLTTLLAGALLQRLAGTLIKSTGLSGTDRFLGFLFGGARGVVACLVVLIALRQFAEAGQWWQTSVLIPELLAFEEDMLAFFGWFQQQVVQLNRE